MSSVARGRQSPSGKSKSSERSEFRSTRQGRHGMRGSRLNFPIAFKFAAFIAVFALAAMVWQAWTALRAAKRHLEQEINHKGVMLVHTVADSIDPEWVRNDNLTFEEQEALNHQLKTFSAGPGREKIQDILIFKALGGSEAIIASAATAGSTAVQRRTEGVEVILSDGPYDNVDIREFDVDGISVRSFSRPIFDDDGQIGRVEVLLSVQEIQESRKSLRDSLTRVSVVACVAASVGAFVLASLLTRPIRALVKDMRQVSQGDLDHQSSVASGDELGDLARTFNVMTSNLQAGQAAKLAQKAMEHELSVATRIQARLLPSNTPRIEGFDLAAFYLAAKEVGGDYYDFVDIDSDHVGVVVADVSGKGVPGSLVMTMTRSLLRMAAEGESSPVKTLLQVNRCLSADMNPGMFVTLLYFVLNKSTREVRLIRAGHNAPILYSARHQKLLHLNPKGIAIGLDQRGNLFQSELEVQRFTLKSGDILVCYTDGIIEGKDRDGEDFGDGQLSQLIRDHHDESSQEIVDAVVAALEKHQKGTDRSDDITLLVLKSR